MRHQAAVFERVHQPIMQILPIDASIDDAQVGELHLRGDIRNHRFGSGNRQRQYRRASQRLYDVCQV